MANYLKSCVLAASALLLTTVFSSVTIADPPGGLPPGLKKKVERGGDLPPGWEKKLRVGDVLDYDIYRHGRVIVPVDNDGVVTLEIEGQRLKLGVDTRRIIDILD
ncbi:hypothetical protein [Haliea sp. E17]|uniref:hypothetical protein n=1 Tax=Haliea sp. E17 TaxID=3401576 RepID=UPI003AAB53C5